jgi:hypothetical protein
MKKEFQEKLFLMGVVGERGHANFAGFLHWHFACASCKHGMSVRSTSSTSQNECPNCKTNYQVWNDGRVFRVEVVEIDVASRFEIAHKNATPTRKGAGFLGRLTGAIKEVNEDVHGKKLIDGLNSTNQQLRMLESHIANSAIAGFLERRRIALAQVPNWSIDGRIKMGKTLQDEAKKKFDFNQAESYSLWLTGAWLESGARNSASAAQVHEFLERIANDLAE